MTPWAAVFMGFAVAACEPPTGPRSSEFPPVTVGERGPEGTPSSPAEDRYGVPDMCAEAATVDRGCMEELDEAQQALCDQVDNDCDGMVDENCLCDPGEVQRCFLGPPGRRGEGACQDGSQTCVVDGEFGLWGPCEGGIGPKPEACDDLDNDCNGCTDEIEDCQPQGSCPGPDDPRVPPGRPFSAYALRGGDFYPGSDAVAWRWEVEGSPCDRMFLGLRNSVANAQNGQLSYRLRGSDRKDATIEFTLSGDYTVTLTVQLEDGTEFTCSWIVNVSAPGLRVELCWDATGPTADLVYGGAVDVDLHLARIGTTNRWFDSEDCYWRTCKAKSSQGNDWGYPDSPIENCTGAGSRGEFRLSCPNPRLDIDNVSTRNAYVPENINLDNPNHGDRFRVMVHHYSRVALATHPLVNIYCDGELKGTYGAAPDLVEGFEQGGGENGGDMWRVADIETLLVDGRTDCTVTPLSPPGPGFYYITTDDPSL